MLLNPPVDHACDLEVILLQEGKVGVAVDADVSQLDPVGLDAGLPQVVDAALVVGDVRGRFTGQGQVRDLGDIGQPSRRLELLDTGTQRRGVFADGDGAELAGRRDGWVVCDRGDGQTVRAGRGPPDGAGRISEVALERNVCRLDVDAADDEIGALVGDESGELCSEGMADDEGWADAAEEIAAVGAHGEFQAGEVRRQREEGGKKCVKDGVAPYARLPLVSINVSGGQVGRRRLTPGHCV